jgi:hypothetical protein
MKPGIPAPRASASRRVRAFALYAAMGFLAAVLFAACGGEEPMAGTTSGVDNPELKVAFVDAGGKALAITGELDVYARDQIPAVDAEPLFSIKVKNSTFTTLTGADFTRLRVGAAKVAASAQVTSAAKVSSESIAGGEDTAAIPFNLILKTQDRAGSLMMGFRYDTSSKAFSNAGSALSSVDVLPKPLARCQAKVALDSVRGGGRIFIPGTPYLAALVNGAFALEDMPEGVFPVQLLGADGKVYPILEPWVTRDSTLVLHPSPHPVGSVDTVGHDSLPDFSVTVGSDREAFLEVPAYLEAKVIGVDAADPRLTVSWKWIPTAGDSAVPPMADPGKAVLSVPTALRTEVKFAGEGVYSFQFAATLGVRTRMDTILISVRRLPSPPKPRIIQPHPGDTAVAGRALTIQWEMPDAGKGPVTIRFSADSGATWIPLIQKYGGKDSVPAFPWTPSKESGVSSKCLIQVTSDLDTTLQARMEGVFNLLQ